MVDNDFFRRPNMEVASDLGLRELRFSKEGQLYVPDKTKRILITQTVAYGTERGFEPEKTKDGSVKKGHLGSFREPGSIYMYFTPWGYVLAISTDEEGKYSHISIHGGLPISGFEGVKKDNLDTLLDGPRKITKGLGIDRELAQALDGQLIYNTPMIAISDEKMPGSFRFDPTPITPAALGTYNFTRKR